MKIKNAMAKYSANETFSYKGHVGKMIKKFNSIWVVTLRHKGRNYRFNYPKNRTDEQIRRDIMKKVDYLIAKV